MFSSVSRNLHTTDGLIVKIRSKREIDADLVFGVTEYGKCKYESKGQLLKFSQLIKIDRKKAYYITYA